MLTLDFIYDDFVIFTLQKLTDCRRRRVVSSVSWSISSKAALVQNIYNVHTPALIICKQKKTEVI